jgi:hypothetical protein
MMETKMIAKKNETRDALIKFATRLITSILFGGAVMLLWNWVIVLIFGLIEISWLQAWGLYVLSNLLFKSNTVGK